MSDLTLDFLGGATVMVMAEMEELGWITIELDEHLRRIVEVTPLGESFGLSINAEGLADGGSSNVVRDLVLKNFAEYPKP